MPRTKDYVGFLTPLCTWPVRGRSFNMKTYMMTLFAIGCVLQICGVLVLYHNPSSTKTPRSFVRVSSKAYQSLADHQARNHQGSMSRTAYQARGIFAKIEEVADVVESKDAIEVNNNTDPSCVERNVEYGEVEDLMCWPRPKFDDSLKNPCWWEDSVSVREYAVGRGRPRSLGTLKCLPYFHILCCSKSGTTDLYNRIKMHREIVPNSGIFGKEQLYWGWSKYGYTNRLTKATPRSFASYLQSFTLIARRLASAAFFKQSLTKKLVTLDASPPDMWDFRGWSLLPQNKGLREPKVLTPHLMRHLYRDPKFIVLMRDPVERMYSAYLFHHMGNDSRSFHRHVLSAIAIFDRCLRSAPSHRECYFNASVTDRLPVELHFMCYAVYLKEWLAVFPRKHFLFMRTEDYKKDVRSHVLKVFQFLDLSPPTPEALNMSVNMPVVYRTRGKDKAGIYGRKHEPCYKNMSHPATRTWRHYSETPGTCGLMFTSPDLLFISLAGCV
ncbi:carbohydrate sulfotransferase 15-like isoform X1 [Pomacea canaliculata]|uniref:carbohydrate sulfotransferase 15-like isoform X1 n=1 Tax=Pomacea canaliculata TaxID=400727 RepID=UPI000D732615|nr:carbohydrate sulfotransferase 15-like isoform X1 [Pomacea canaliculata]